MTSHSSVNNRDLTFKYCYVDFSFIEILHFSRLNQPSLSLLVNTIRLFRFFALPFQSFLALAGQYRKTKGYSSRHTHCGWGTILGEGIKWWKVAGWQEVLTLPQFCHALRSVLSWPLWSVPHTKPCIFPSFSSLCLIKTWLPTHSFTITYLKLQTFISGHA